MKMIGSLLFLLLGGCVPADVTITLLDPYPIPIPASLTATEQSYDWIISGKCFKKASVIEISFNGQEWQDSRLFPGQDPDCGENKSFTFEIGKPIQEIWVRETVQGFYSRSVKITTPDTLLEPVVINDITLIPEVPSPIPNPDPSPTPLPEPTIEYPTTEQSNGVSIYKVKKHGHRVDLFVSVPASSYIYYLSDSDCSISQELAHGGNSNPSNKEIRVPEGTEKDYVCVTAYTSSGTLRGTFLWSSLVP